MNDLQISNAECDVMRPIWATGACTAADVIKALRETPSVAALQTPIADGTLINKERFFHLHVDDWNDDAGAESVCYSVEGRQFIATRIGVQISADDGPTQIILPVPDFSRVTGVALGGKNGDLLFALCGNKIWKRKIQQHAMGAFTPWANVNGTKL